MNDISIFLNVVIGCLTVAGSVAAVIKQGYESQQKLNESIALLNERLSKIEGQILVRLESFKGSQNLDEYRFTDIDNKLRDLERHIKDSERFLENRLDFVSRPYVAFDDTLIKKKLEKETEE